VKPGIEAAYLFIHCWPCQYTCGMYSHNRTSSLSATTFDQDHVLGVDNNVPSIREDMHQGESIDDFLSQEGVLHLMLHLGQV